MATVPTMTNVSMSAAGIPAVQTKAGQWKPTTNKTQSKPTTPTNYSTRKTHHRYSLATGQERLRGNDSRKGMQTRGKRMKKGNGKGKRRTLGFKRNVQLFKEGRTV